MANVGALFANGHEYRSWCAVNCDRCVKGYDNEASDWRCDLEKSVNYAAITDGHVPDEIYARLGAEGHTTELGWTCAEFAGG